MMNKLFQNWQRDMREMLEDHSFLVNAQVVQPFHRENTEKVKGAIMNIKITAREVLQVKLFLRYTLTSSL